MKKIFKFVVTIILILSTMFFEYRFIRPYLGENNTVYLEIFNQVDEYNMEE